MSGPDDRSIYKSLSTQEPRDGGGAPGGGDLAMEKVPEQRVPEQRAPARSGAKYTELSLKGKTHEFHADTRTGGMSPGT